MTAFFTLINRLLFAKERAAMRRASLSRKAWRLVASDRAARREGGEA